jgi:hypothetical protein
MHERFKKDLEDLRQLAGRRDMKALGSQAEYADKLTADYLLESERLFELMSRLGRDGVLESSRNG